MSLSIKLEVESLQKIREMNPLLMSYNVEFAEVTGGTFWKAYTPGQIAGTEPFIVQPSKDGGITSLYKDLMQVYPPINLYDKKLRKLTKELGPAWCRVSGTWATKTYYDFDGTTNGKVPEGYLNVLTKEQWIGVLDFVKECGLKLIVSISNCPGLHSAKEPWHPTEAEKLFGFSKAYGVPIDAAEFTNEPNMLEETGFPKGYTAEHYRRDQDLFFEWLDKHYPEVLKVGPSTTGGDNLAFGKQNSETGGVEQLIGKLLGCDDLMKGTKVPLDVFSYHYYNGLSDRLASLMPQGHWQPEEATSEEYLDTALRFCKTYLPFRDKYVPNGEMWVTESGDAGGGGDTWASTFLDVFRTLNELGGFCTLTNGIIFHNTLASSDYGFLARQVFDPRPNYFAVLLWNRLMGSVVYDSKIKTQEGAHIYVHSRKDGKEGCVYLVINNSRTKTTTLELPKNAMRYQLEGKDGDIRATVMTCNGTPLVLGENNSLPEITPVEIQAGKVEIKPATIEFFVF